MKYVINKGRYAIAFEVEVNGKKRKVEFDKRRYYRDTGNLATNGITPVDDDVYAILLENKQFEERIESKELELTDEPQLDSGEENVALKKENAKLKAELEKAKKTEEKADDKQKEIVEAKDKEIASLKAQLEKLSKKDKK